MNKNRLTYDFYNRNVVMVAKELLGKKLIFGNHEGIITETEAYGGDNDEASHAYKGITKRSNIMFGPPGVAYIYLIYGMYHCLNIVTQKEGDASAVLIRGLKFPHIHLNGPGKICKYLNIDKSYNGLDIVNNDIFYLTKGLKPANIEATPRIGINKATDKLWRFILFN
jgi:DNA-3-methyladenine glycosylase